MNNDQLITQSVQMNSDYGLYEYVGNGKYRMAEPYNTIFRVLFVVCLLGVTFLATKKEKSNLQIGLIVILSIILILIVGLKLVYYIRPCR